MRKRAGMLLSADMMNDNSIDEQTSSGLQLEDDFSFLSFIGRKLNGLTSITITLEYVGSDVTATSAGNIGDVLVGSLPDGWIPPHTVNDFWGKGDTSDGNFTCLASGTITLKTMNNASVLTAGNTVALSFMWISENR